MSSDSRRPSTTLISPRAAKVGKPPRRIFLQPSEIFTSPPVYIRRRRTDDPIDSKLLEVVNHPSKSPHHGSQPRATSGSPRDAVRRSAPFPSRLISGRTRRPRASRITSLEPQVSSLARWKGPRPRQPSSSPSTPQTLRGDVFFKPTPRPNGSSQSDLDNGFEFVFNNSTGSRRQIRTTSGSVTTRLQEEAEASTKNPKRSVEGSSLRSPATEDPLRLHCGA